MKSIYLILTSLFFSTAAISQAETYIGAQAGYTKASEDYGAVFVPAGATTHINGILTGVLVRKQWGRLFIDIEPQYRRRGAACIPNFRPFTGDESFHLDYVELPISMGYRFLSFRKLDVSGKLGYSLSHLLKATNVSFRDIDGDRIPESQRMDTNLFHDIDHSIQVGAQIGFWVSKNTKLLGTISHSRGFRDTLRGFSSKHRSLDISMGLIYRI